MFVHVSSRTETSHGPVIPFTCPKCCQDITGEIIETVERGKLYGVLPVATFRSTFITCPACGKKFGMAMPLAKLHLLPPETVASLILRGPPKSARWIAIAGVVLMLVPFLGMILSATSLFLGRGNAGWVRALGWLGLIVNITVTGCFVALAFIR